VIHAFPRTCTKKRTQTAQVSQGKTSVSSLSPSKGPTSSPRIPRSPLRFRGILPRRMKEPPLEFFFCVSSGPLGLPFRAQSLSPIHFSTLIYFCFDFPPRFEFEGDFSSGSPPLLSSPILPFSVLPSGLGYFFPPPSPFT